MKSNALTQKSDFFGSEKISKILFRIAPPIMLAQLIQALYNMLTAFLSAVTQITL